jgi:hypothetical protein
MACRGSNRSQRSTVAPGRGRDSTPSWTRDPTWGLSVSLSERPGSQRQRARGAGGASEACIGALRCCSKGAGAGSADRENEAGGAEQVRASTLSRGGVTYHHFFFVTSRISRERRHGRRHRCDCDAAEHAPPFGAGGSQSQASSASCRVLPPGLELLKCTLYLRVKNEVLKVGNTALGT